MIIIRIWGGIGNQLFQYSFGEYLRLKTGIDIEYDINSFGNSDKLRNYQLDIINPNLPIYTAKMINISKHTGVVNRVLRLLFTISGKNKFITEDKYIDYKLDFEKYRSVYMQGYWQKINYVEAINNTCPTIFSPKQIKPKKIYELERKIASSEISVSIHVRRGDYFNSKNKKVFGICNVDYYHNALNIIKSRYGEANVFMFSDDIEWVKNNISVSENTIYIENDEEINPFWYIYIMSKCNHNIISNSTFSWWGAYLNKYSKKIVICPQRWNLLNNETPVLLDWTKL